MNEEKTIGIAAMFYKSPGGRLTLESLVVDNKEVSRSDGKTYIGRNYYDVDWSRAYGYIFHMSGGGGARDAAEVSGIYFTSGEITVKEESTTRVDRDDKPPWKSKKTRAIRERNRTRRLRKLPKAFEIRPGEDLLDWMESNAIHDEVVYCSTCKDYLPSGDLCRHCWFCDKTSAYSTPSERCKCADREVCRDD